MGNLGQLRGGYLIRFRPERYAHYRDVVNAHRFDHRRHNAQILREPVVVAVDLIVQIENGLLTRDTHFEGDGQNGLAGLADGEYIVHAFDFRQHLFSRDGHQLLDFTGAGTGEANEHVGECHINLRFFFFRRHHNGEESEQQAQ